MAIDLGTANTLVYVKGRGVILSEPSVVAYHVKTEPKRCLPWVRTQKLMLGRTPCRLRPSAPCATVSSPNFDVAEEMIKHFIRKVHKRSTFYKPKIIVCVPHGATPVEKRAIRQSVLSAGARKAGWLPNQLPPQLVRACQLPIQLGTWLWISAGNNRGCGSVTWRHCLCAFSACW